MGRRNSQLVWWLIFLSVIAVLVSAGVVVIRRWVSPGPSPSTPTTYPVPASSGPAETPARADPTNPVIVRPAGAPLLHGSGGGEVFGQSATGIYRIDLATGRVVRTPTPVLEQFSSFVAGPGWVIFKTIDNPPGVIVRDGKRAEPLPPGLQPNGRLRPAPGGTLWLMPEDPTNGARVTIRVAITGDALGRQRIRTRDEFGISGADGAGYLILPTTGGIFQARPEGARRESSGRLVAVSRRRLLVWDCDTRARCRPYLVDRASQRRTKLPTSRRPLFDLYQSDPADAYSDGGGELSPDGRHVFLTPPSAPDNPSPAVVLDLRSGRINRLPGSMTDSNPNGQYAWTSNSRYLLALTDHRLRGYDTHTHTTATLDITTEQLLHLTKVGATDV